MPKGQPVSGKTNSWNDVSEKRLLLLMVSGISITKDWDDIASKMGPTYSVSACKQKYAKLKAAIEKECGAGSTSRKGGNTAIPAKVTAKPKPTPKNSGHKRASPSEDDEDDEEFPMKPSPKRMKKEDSVMSSSFIKRDETETVDLERDDLYDEY